MVWKILWTKNSKEWFNYIQTTQRGYQYTQRKQSKNKEVNEMQKSFWDKNIEFNKERELSEKTQAEMMLEVKNLINQIKMSVESLPCRN